ncbi:MAG: hypothetical protein Q9190_000180 [Brigantiaea leucoxantha]
MAREKTHYFAIPSDPPSSTDLHITTAAPNRQNDSLDEVQLSKYRSRVQLLLSLALALLFLALALLIYDLTSLRHKSSDTDSPMMEAVEYQGVTWNNDLRQPSIYRGQPNKKLEKAWDDLWRHGSLAVPPSKLQLLNKSLDDDWQRTASGDVLAEVEVFHQLHCLNTIRQYTFRDTYTDPNNTFHITAQPPAFQRIHVDHCIETLRRTLMCYGDVTPLPIKVDKKSPTGQAVDFSSFHKCRNYEKLRDWAVEHKANARED